ncbi:MAG TPA: BACON domain-containing carbohydrate-binding protein, partial [Paludibacter sp.]
PLKSQTTLLPGDIAFIGINTDGSTDDFDFVLLTPISSGTVINFTDCGWNHSTGFNTIETESHCTWTASSALPAGTIVNVITNNGNTRPIASTGIFTGDSMLVSIAGDQIIAYQETKASPKFLAAISFNQNSISQPGSDFDGASTTNSTTALPEGLTMGINAVHIYQSGTYQEHDNGRYKGTLNTGTKLELLKRINLLSNWETNDNTVFTLNPFPASFTLNTSTLSVSPNNSITYPKTGGTTNLNVTSNTIWAVSSNQTWLTLNKRSGTENAVVTLSAASNGTSADRTATVTFTSSGLSPVTITITQAGTVTGLPETTINTISLYPNPVNDGFYIQNVDRSIESVSVYDLRGIEMFSQQVIGNYINTINLKHGVYIVKLKTADEIIEKKIMKN